MRAKYIHMPTSQRLSLPSTQTKAVEFSTIPFLIMSNSISFPFHIGKQGFGFHSTRMGTLENVPIFT